ncbi:2-phospho-L-lactate guanylyltransferase [Auraticoccus monumenti]|uniref:2-phospho-L-lactate guanylyltransferase n=1 Tax=Auraticoccus monumenti TaxID=675864 RepID=A0A1G7CNM7_9ACTN|nr:2-phospho-L-lactate guanylyltransferase [Auraticoccus monumenti]SDE41014.1 2-phospho-L-lactate guanylyltransferase [Auraticoccus monumenti]
MQGQAEQVAAVVAVKAWSRAKSRLDALPAERRSGLAAAMALDTCLALTGAGLRLLVVTDEPLLPARWSAAGVPVEVLGDPGTDLNGALTAGDAELRRTGASTVLAVVADLPCLVPAAVSGLLAAAGAGRGRWFVPDSTGVGTTVLLARDRELEPRFEGASADRHRRSGAQPLAAPAGVRRDVDDEVSLERALELGVGAHTAAWAADRPG